MSSTGHQINPKTIKLVSEAVVQNKRHGILGHDWIPSNYEYGNIEAEAQTAILAYQSSPEFRGLIEAVIDVVENVETIDPQQSELLHGLLDYLKPFISEA